MDGSRTRDRTEMPENNLKGLFLEFRFLFRRALTNDSEAMNRLPFYFVVGADRRGLSNIGMTINRFLDFPSPDAVSRDVYHIIGSTQNKIIAIFVLFGVVESREQMPAGDLLEVMIFKQLIILPDLRQASRRQWQFAGHHTFLSSGQVFTCFRIDNRCTIAETRQARRTGLNFTMRRA